MANERSTLTLGELGPIVTGKTPPTRVSAYFGGNIPFITPRDMAGRKTINSTERFLSEKGAQAVANAVIPAGSVMVSCIGSDMGKVAIAGRECVTNQQINSIIASDVHCADYIYYNLSQRKLELRSLASGSAQPILNKGHFSQVPIEMPPKKEQECIAHILGTLDDKIELNRRMNRTLEKMVAAIFKSWFIDFDPVCAKAEGQDPGLPNEIAKLFPESFENSELGPIPRGWEPGALGDISANPRRGVKPDQVSPTTPYIGLQHMPRRCIALDTWGRANEVGSQKSQFKEGEVLFGKLRPYFHKVGIAPVDGVCSTDILVVVPKAEYWHSYVLSLVSSKALVDYTDSHSAGTKMPRTNWKDMSRYPLVLPPVEVARAFQDHVAALHRRIGVSVRQNRRLARLRNTLLPMLLSGELEVPDTSNAGEGVA